MILIQQELFTGCSKRAQDFKLTPEGPSIPVVDSCPQCCRASLGRGVCLVWSGPDPDLNSHRAGTAPHRYSKPPLAEERGQTE